MKNYRIIKGKKIHVNQLAAYSRKFTVSNTAKSISPVVEHKTIAVYNNPIVNPLTGNKFDQVNPHQIPGKFGISITGYDWVQPEGLLWEHKRYKQPKRLIKYKKRRYSDWKSYSNQHGEKKLKREKRNDFVTYFKNYPYTLPKMNQVEYMEKLTEHKLAKWERKNPCPMDMFTEDVEKWKQLRENMKMHFRDVVVSIYDKLKIVGNYVDVEKKKVKKKVVATIRDIDGKGHNVDHPALSTNHKLYKSAVSAATKAMKRDHAIIDCDLKNHKGDQTRPLLITRSDLRKAA